MVLIKNLDEYTILIDILIIFYHKNKSETCLYTFNAIIQMNLDKCIIEQNRRQLKLLRGILVPN